MGEQIMMHGRGRLFAALLPFAAGSVVASAGVAGSFVDSAQRSVRLPAPVDKIAPVDAAAQVFLQALAPGKLAGLVAPFTPDHAIYVDPTVLALPQLPDLTRTAAPGDRNAVRATKPSLDLAVGPVDARLTAAVDAIQNDLAVPTLLLTNDLNAAAPLAARLGEASGASDRGAVVEAAIADALAAVKPLAVLPDGERTTVFVGFGSDGLGEPGAEDPTIDQAIHLAGGRRVRPAPGSTGGLDAIVALKPAVVIVPESEATHGALRKALPGTRFLLDAGEPYRTFTGPASINRLAGVLALAALLHPGKVKIDPDAAARLETALFPIPPGLSMPTPLQVR